MSYDDHVDAGIGRGAAEGSREAGYDPQELAEEALRTRLSANVGAEDKSETGRTLADLFKGRIGTIHGIDEALSENTGIKFTEYLVEKHRNGHL